MTGNSSTENGSLEENYFALVPTADPGTLRPIVSSASPIPGSYNININDGGPVSAPTTLTIANRDTTVDANSIVFKLNGISVPIVKTVQANGVQVDWKFADTPGAALISASLAFTDSQGTNQTYSWTYSYPFLAASNSLPVGALTARGWDYRMVQTADVLGAGNSLLTAEAQLNGTIPEDQTYITNAPNGVQLMQWNNDTACPRDVYGLTGTCGSPAALDNIVTEALGYMHLTAGAHRFYVSSDDGIELQSGTTPSDPAATVMGYRDGGTINGTFDFLVEADGLYPVRFLWYEHGGGANLELDSVNLSDNSHVLINDPANTAGVVQVFLPDGPLTQVITTLSSATAAGPYTVEPGATVDTNLKTVTVQQSGAVRFYRLSFSSALKITQIKKVGSTIVMTYQ